MDYIWSCWLESNQLRPPYQSGILTGELQHDIYGGYTEESNLYASPRSTPSLSLRDMAGSLYPLVEPLGIEPSLSALQADAMTTLAQVPLLLYSFISLSTLSLSA